MRISEGPSYCPIHSHTKVLSIRFMLRSLSHSIKKFNLCNFFLFRGSLFFNWKNEYKSLYWNTNFFGGDVFLHILRVTHWRFDQFVGNSTCAH